MPPTGLKTRLHYRVLDNDSGLLLLRDLPHMGGTWTVRGLQQGYPGASQIGDFRIQLPPVRTGDFRKHADDFWSLDRRQRIEAFPGDDITGSPRFSGVISGIEYNTDQPCVISGFDSLQLLQSSKLLPGEQILAPFTARFLVDVFHVTRELIWDDDFSGFGGGSGPHPSTDYFVQNASAATDPYRSKPSVTSTSVQPALGYILTKTFWGVNAEYAPSTITIQGTCKSGTDTGSGGEAGILMHCDSTVQNGVLVRANMRLLSGTTYAVDAQIYSITAGVYTLQGSSTDIFPGIANVFPFEVTATEFQWGASRVIRCLINGKNACQYLTASLPASGGIGFRHQVASATGSPVVYVNRLRMESRTGNWGTDRFQPGTVATGGANVQQSVIGSGQSHLDMLMLASAADGFWLRKTPGFGYKADTYDYNSDPGTDLTGSVRFTRDNIVSAKVVTLGELFGDGVRVNAVPGGDSGGSITWSRLQTGGSMVLSDVVADIGIPGYDLLTTYAQRIQGRKAPGVFATQLTIMRTGDVADKFRELDHVFVDYPDLRIYKQSKRVIGYTFTENDPTMVVFLDELPGDASLPGAMRRLTGPTEFVTNTFNTR